MQEYEYKVTAAGRVNLIGEHVDYCGGKVMPVALSMNNAVYVRPNGKSCINLSWTTLGDTLCIDLNRLDFYRESRYGKYQAGCAYLWREAGHKIVGCDMLQHCTVPFGSGLSSSAAIEVSTLTALAVMAGEKPDPVEIALLAQKAEAEYAGVNCGIMDQYASACGKRDMAMLLDCKSLECEYLPFDLGKFALVIANTNKPHNLVKSRYNERRAETEEALALLREKTGAHCLADVTIEEFERYCGLLSPKIRARAQHVVEECDRVQKAAAALREGNIALFGACMNESHRSLKELYEVTGKELDALALSAQRHPACVGSRMTGGGFGGCTISLVEKSEVENFKRTISVEYKKMTGYNVSFYEAEVSDGIQIGKGE